MRPGGPVGGTPLIDQPAGNFFDKHHSRNPAVRFLMNQFHDHFGRLIGQVAPRSVLDAGCGEGYTTRRILSAAPQVDLLAGMDIAPQVLRTARGSCPELSAFAGSAEKIPLADGAFDLVIACEILEHLEDPDAAVREIRRVSKGPCLFSVPWEPVWRILNIARGAYWTDLGNTPGHRNHWSRAGFRRLLEPHFASVRIVACWTWTFALCGN